MVLIQYTYRNWVVLTAVHPRLGHPFKLKMWSLMTWPTWPSWLFNKRIPSHGFVAFWDLGWPSGFMPLGGLSRRSGMPRNFMPFVDTPLLGPAFLLTSGIRIFTILSASCRLLAGKAFTLLLFPCFGTSWDGKCENNTESMSRVFRVSLHSREYTITVL